MFLLVMLFTTNFNVKKFKKIWKYRLENLTWFLIIDCAELWSWSWSGANLFIVR